MQHDDGDAFPDEETKVLKGLAQSAREAPWPSRVTPASGTTLRTGALSEPRMATGGMLAELLREFGELDTKRGVSRFVSDALNVVLRALGDCAVAATVTDPRQGTSSLIGAAAGRTLPPPPPDVAQSSQAVRRVFPSEKHERLVVVDAAEVVFNLHIACTDESLEQPGSALDLVIQQLVLSLRPWFLVAQAEGRRAEEVEKANVLRRASADLDRVNSLGVLALGTAHDLAGPLTSIAHYADALATSHADKPGNTADMVRIGRVQRAAGHAMDLARGLVEYARPTRGPRMPVLLVDVITRARDICEDALDLLDGDLQLDAEPGVRVLGHSKELTQMFVNLFMNACAAMERGRACLEVSVSASSDGERAFILVGDSGRGIPQEDLPHVFSPFFSKREDGTGVGLAVVEHIVEAHGGTIRVESEVDVGSRFFIDLPLFAG
jgi:signal transduction histidine kinase